MDYCEAISYLENCYRFGSKKGYDNFRKLMDMLGDPQKNLNVIHVAGTNGKGSVCAMLYSILLEQGYNVGLFTSPHLVSYNERISAGGKYICNDDFARHIEIIKNKVLELFNNTDEFFSFFEIITAAAFNYFYEKNLDFVILEVGLGGRLDSTNIIEKSLVSVICSISFDHTEYLGNTISEIAWEKGGIIKKNSFTVLYSQSKKVYNVINKICSEKKSKLFYTEDYGIEIVEQNLDGTIFNVSNDFFSYNNVFIGLCGDYQVFNACNALMTVEALKKQGVIISKDAVFKGVAAAKIRGRMDVVMKEPLFIIEGAHNSGGTGYLNSFIKGLKNYNKKVTIIIGILSDKNYCEMIKDLAEFSDNIIFTETENKRTIKVEKLINAYSGQSRVFLERDFKKAIKLALDISGKNDCVICAGSLYLAGDVLKFLDNYMA